LKGGDEEWIIHGLEATNNKLKKLSKINNILAHQPWKLTKKDLDELFQGGKSRWNMDEFIHASSILIFFHRLSSIVESLRYSFNNDMLKNNIGKVKESDDIKYHTEDKKKLYNNLLEMNEEKERVVDNKTKYSDEKNTSINYNIDNVIDSEPFKKYISNFCTLYLDFDTYSDTFQSSVVLLLLYRILITLIRVIIYYQIYIRMELML
jgi:hypothetical protein